MSPVLLHKQRDHFAARMLETEIERRGLPAIRLSQVADRISKFPQSFLRVIGRTIIHHQNLPLFSWEILRQGARNRFFDVFTVVVGIDQNAEEGGSHSSSRRGLRQLRALRCNDLFEDRVQAARNLPIRIVALEFS